MSDAMGTAGAITDGQNDIVEVPGRRFALALRHLRRENFDATFDRVVALPAEAQEAAARERAVLRDATDMAGYGFELESNDKPHRRYFLAGTEANVVGYMVLDARVKPLKGVKGPIEVGDSLYLRVIGVHLGHKKRFFDMVNFAKRLAAKEGRQGRLYGASIPNRLELWKGLGFVEIDQYDKYPTETFMVFDPATAPRRAKL